MTLHQLHVENMTTLLMKDLLLHLSFVWGSAAVDQLHVEKMKINTRDERSDKI